MTGKNNTLIVFSDGATVTLKERITDVIVSMERARAHEHGFIKAHKKGFGTDAEIVIMMREIRKVERA